MTVSEKIADWTTRLQQSTRDFEQQFGNLDETQLNWSPNASVWSIGQNIDHLIKINASFFPILEELDTGAIRLPFTAKIGFFNKFIGNFILKSVQPANANKVKTFPVWTPVSSDISGKIVQQFTDCQDELIEKIKRTETHLSKGAIIYSPANRRMTYPLETAFEIITVHERRHLQQANTILDLLPV